jgi:hypothetical protein
VQKIPAAPKRSFFSQRTDQPTRSLLSLPSVRFVNYSHFIAFNVQIKNGLVGLICDSRLVYFLLRRDASPEHVNRFSPWVSTALVRCVFVARCDLLLVLKWSLDVQT